MSLASPALTSSDFGCVLVLGKSGSGKTTWVKKVIDKIKPKKMIVVNADASDYKNSCSDTLGGFTPDDYPMEETNSVYITEDIINVSSSAEKNLRKSLNYFARHKNQKHFFVSHSILRTSLWSMLNFFHFIVFTLHASNIFIVRQVITYFRVGDKNQINEIVKKIQQIFNQLKSNGPPKNPTSCIFFNVQNLTLIYAENIFLPDKFITLELQSQNSPAPEFSTSNLIKSPENEAHSNLLERLSNRFEQMITEWKNKSEAICIFSIIINCINVDFIRFNDLVFCFSSRTKSNIYVSLVDYIRILLSRKKLPSRNIKVLHTYLSAKCQLPQHYQKNKMLKNLISEK